MNPALEILISHLNPVHILIGGLTVFGGVVGAFVIVALALIRNKTAIDTPIFKLNVKKDER